MRLMSIAIVLIFCKCNYAQEATSAYLESIIEDVFPPFVSTNSNPECGVRNKNGGAFNLIDRENNAQFGEFMIESDASIFKSIYRRHVFFFQCVIALVFQINLYLIHIYS